MESTVSVIRLSKSYASLCAVENLNLHIHRSEVFGLLGANGAGKSTAIECILGTKRADQGSVTILGMKPEKDRKKLFERVGVQFQEASYQDKITVTELCEITESLYRMPLDFRALLKQFGLSEKLHRTGKPAEIQGRPKCSGKIGTDQA
jgi:ABC-2 type transport system ATP-binding protein